MSEPGARIDALVEPLFRRQYGRLVAGLTRIFGPARLDLVEDVVQESLLRAMRTWPFEGVPDRPERWLATVARNLATDALRHDATAAQKQRELATWATAAAAEAPPDRLPDEVADDTLRLIFTTCHPSLTPETRVALTLKTLCGFGVSEVAAALLAREATVAQRLSRAKAQLQRSEIDFVVPPPAELELRLASVLEVLYLLFNEGYRVHRGQGLVRRDLVAEAVRLAELLCRMPETDQPQVHALLALMRFLGARLPARTDAFGELLTLSHQDRERWDRDWLQRGFAHFARSIAGDRRTAFHVEAAIASVHAAAPTYADTDWVAVLRHYDDLVAEQDSPVVRLNRAVALAKVHGLDAGLAELERLDDDPKLRHYGLLPATRAQLLWSRGDPDAAAAAYRAALALECSEPEQQFLQARLRRCEAGDGAPAW
ncbi:MAG: sigma-70 family RNA polymerase sigma factor [Planctomycetota bacterium]